MNSRIARLAWISAVGLLSLDPVQAEEPGQHSRCTQSSGGLVIEGEYRTGSKPGFKPRYVSGKHETQAPVSAVTVDGSHIGLQANWWYS